MEKFGREWGEHRGEPETNLNINLPNIFSRHEDLRVVCVCATDS